MAIFKYKLPSGSEYTVDCPNGTTQEQADTIFYQQVAAGAVAGMANGQKLTSADAVLRKFELSRLDRGIAGVSNADVLTIINNQPTIASVVLPPLTDVPLNNPVTQADIALAKEDGLGPVAVGSLTPIQVQSLQAQIISQVDQSSEVISIEKGLGQFGFACWQLELAGYIKPGTTNRFLTETNYIQLLNSPSVWTGKNGITSLEQLLKNPPAQTTVQTELMVQSVQALQANGLLQTPITNPATAFVGEVYSDNTGGLESFSTAVSKTDNSIGVASGGQTTISSALGRAALTLNSIGALQLATSKITGAIAGDVGALITNASKFGPQLTAAWANPGAIGDKLSSLGTNAVGQLELTAKNAAGQLQAGFDQLSAQAKAQLDGYAKMAKYSMDFASDKLGSLVSGVKSAAAYTGTVDRTTVDAAVTRVLGNPKIPTPTFSFPSPGSLGSQLDIAYAQNLLKSTTGQVTTLISNVQGQATALQTQANTLTGQSTAVINRLRA